MTVENPWDRIAAWLRVCAPVSAAHLGPPASAGDIAAVEALMNRPLPADLAAWWRQWRGVTEYIEGRLIPPDYAPCTIAEVVSSREAMLFVYSCDDDAETAEFVAAPAGTRCPPYWLPVWLPIAASAGPCFLVCDLRHGPLHGCVMEWDEYRAASVEKRWTSVTAMLTEIADALEYRTDIDGCQPQRSDGTLDWW